MNFKDTKAIYKHEAKQVAKLIYASEYWAEHPEHCLNDWKYEINNNDTRQGYWQWVNKKIDESRCKK